MINASLFKNLIATYDQHYKYNILLEWDHPFKWKNNIRPPYSVKIPPDGAACSIWGNNPLYPKLGHQLLMDIYCLEKNSNEPRDSTSA